MRLFSQVGEQLAAWYLCRLDWSHDHAITGDFNNFDSDTNVNPATFADDVDEAVAELHATGGAEAGDCDAGVTAFDGTADALGGEECRVESWSFVAWAAWGCEDKPVEEGNGGQKAVEQNGGDDDGNEGSEN